MKKLNGYTILEFTVVLILITFLIVISISALFPQINRARKEAFIDDANNISKAAINKYTQEGINDDDDDNIYLHEDEDIYIGRSCYSLDSLKGKYIKKTKKEYKGSVEVCHSSNCLYRTKLWLTNGKYYLSAARDNVIMLDLKESAKNINKCGIKK